jgi:hypothetical protein
MERSFSDPPAGSRAAGADPRCDCGREVDYRDQQCPGCREQYRRELEEL